MDAISEFTKLSGLQQLQAIFAGKTGYIGITRCDIRRIARGQSR